MSQKKETSDSWDLFYNPSSYFSNFCPTPTPNPLPSNIPITDTASHLEKLVSYPSLPQFNTPITRAPRDEKSTQVPFYFFYINCLSLFPSCARCSTIRCFLIFLKFFLFFIHPNPSPKTVGLSSYRDRSRIDHPLHLHLRASASSSPFFFRDWFPSSPILNYKRIIVAGLMFVWSDLVQRTKPH